MSILPYGKNHRILLYLYFIMVLVCVFRLIEKRSVKSRVGIILLVTIGDQLQAVGMVVVGVFPTPTTVSVAPLVFIIKNGDSISRSLNVCPPCVSLYILLFYFSSRHTRRKHGVLALIIIVCKRRFALMFSGRPCSPDNV